MQQATRKVVARRVGSLVLMAILGAVLIGFTDPKPAPMVLVCSGDVVTSAKVTGGRADFGGDPHLLGVPTNSGRICWGNGGAIVEGQLFYDHLTRAGCAHIIVRFFNSNTPTRQQLSVFTQKVCSPGGLRQTSIFSQVNGSTANTSTRVGRVFIELLTSETSAGAKTSVASRGFTN